MVHSAFKIRYHAGCSCVLTVGVIIDSHRPDPQETEQGVAVTAHLPLGVMSVKLLYLVGTLN